MMTNGGFQGCWLCGKLGLVDASGPSPCPCRRKGPAFRLGGLRVVLLGTKRWIVGPGGSTPYDDAVQIPSDHMAGPSHTQYSFPNITPRLSGHDGFMDGDFITSAWISRENTNTEPHVSCLP